MKVWQVIEIIKNVPADAEVQIEFYDQEYERPRTIGVKTIAYKESWRVKGEAEEREPNRIVLS